MSAAFAETPLPGSDETEMAVVGLLLFVSNDVLLFCVVVIVSVDDDCGISDGKLATFEFCTEFDCSRPGSGGNADASKSNCGGCGGACSCGCVALC